MNLLFVTGEPPWPAHSGARLRSLAFLRALAPRHTVHLVCPAPAAEVAEVQRVLADLGVRAHCAAPNSRPAWRRATDAVWRPEPDLALRLQSPQFIQAIADVWADAAADVVHAVGLETLPPVLAARACLDGGVDSTKIVLDQQNVEHRIQQQAAKVALQTPKEWPLAVYSWTQARKLRNYERKLGAVVDAALAVSPEDQGALTAALPGLPVHLVPNGVDTQRYLPAAAPATVDEGHRLLFIGALDYRPNVDAASWFVQSVMPLLRDTAPAARLEIVGRSPGPVMRGLTSANVTVAGDVADDVPYFQRASVFVLPMRFGGGSRLKLLQALACGLPVVTTSAGAWGVEVRDGEHCVIADGAPAFAAAVAGLLRDPDWAADLGRRGRALAQRYDWDAVIPRLEAAYASVTVASERARR